ncbi:MAG TPA: BMP family ABC transporter substrate-binding protein [Candidatus Faecousia intestinavium]|nr:BMP family ABC transporter substrate-binding protein [Candidatus Faecousia intestinavium]
MKKILALLLALVMVMSLAACGSSDTTSTTAAAGETQAAGETAAAGETEAAAQSADDIADEMTSSDGKYQIAFVTDVGSLKDKSFNQGTYDGVKLYAAAAGKSYKYYQPANGNEATDDDRYNAMKLAADNGAEVVVCAGFLQEAALRKAAEEFTDVKFVFIDGSPLNLANVASIAFQEEQCGYLAGYAAVMDGYTKLGFSGGGGGTNAACNRYGYGFVQGADAAAKELGVQVEMNYSWLYGSSFSASNELQTMAAGWYQNGTEVIFACGGSMFQSISAAASAEDGKVIGVDVDQSYESPTVITSAMKGIGAAAQQALTAAESEETWTAFVGDVSTAVTLGAAEGAVGLPTDTWSLEGWTVEEYEAMLAQIVDGTLTVDGSDVPEPASTDNVTVNIVK